jgi:Family of unknown function (DUF6545)
VTLDMLGVAQGVVCFLVLAFMISLLVRAPRNVPLLAVTITIASFALMFAMRAIADAGRSFLGLEPITARLFQHNAMVLGGYGLIAFFLFSALDIREARRRAIWQAIPVGAAAVIMTVATLLMPVGIRDAAADLTSARANRPVAEPTVALLYLTLYLYQVYAFSTALVWTRRCVRGAEPRLRRGLTLASVGLAAMIPAEVVFVGTQIARWMHRSLPHQVLLIAIPLMLFGIVVFVIGVVYPAAVMRLAALWVWWQHRRMYRRLGPLWTALHQEFPEDALSRVPAGRWRDALRLRGVHRRYYRRVIECRDGLVRISPYLAADDGDLPLADRLRTGLRAHANGTAAPSRALPVAIPASDGLDADVHELVALSDALARPPSRRNLPARTGDALATPGT